MFCRSLLRSSRVLRTARYASPKFSTPTFVASRTCIVDMTQEQIDLEKEMIPHQQTFNSALDNIRLPKGIDSTLTRLLLPLLDYATQNNELDTIKDQMEKLLQIFKDPIEMEEFQEAFATSPDSLDLSPAVFAVVEEVLHGKLTSKFEELCEGYMHVCRQLSKDRALGVVLPSEPTKEEIDIMENELKAFYFKDPEINLTLNVTISPGLGHGRIYCFSDNMIDLTTTDFATAYRAAADAPTEEFISVIKQFEDLLKKPVNYDLAPCNKLHQEGFNRDVNKVFAACGFIAS